MNPLGILKGVTEFVVSIGAGAVVGNAIKASTPRDLKLIPKVSIAIGGFVLSNMVGDMAAKYAAKSIDDAREEMQKAKDAFYGDTREDDWMEHRKTASLDIQGKTE